MCNRRYPPKCANSGRRLSVFPSIMRFIFWLRYMVKTAAFRSYRGLFYVFMRLIRYCQSIVNGKEEDFRKRPGGLAFSQSGTNQPDSQPAPPVSLAVPLLEAPPQSLPSRGSQPQTDIQNLQVPTPGISELDVTTPDQTFDITLIPITPLEINRYGRNVRVYANCISSELAKS